MSETNKTLSDGATPLWKISNYRPFGIIERDPSESTYEVGDDKFPIIVDVRGSFQEQQERATRIVHAVNSLATNETRIAELEAAAEANFAWHVAEELSLGSFQVRMELCNYSQWLTQKALGGQFDYKGVPRLLLDLETTSVNIARCDVNNCKALVSEALEAAVALAEEE